MTPLLIATAGLVALVAGGLVLRTFGPQYRIGRLLASTPRVSIGEANAIAVSGRRAYVRVDGRIDADDEFEDADHRPLVFRRVRLEARVGRGWRAFEDHRQVVPFVVNEGLDSIAIDIDALGEGLIVVPRESVGRAADLADRVPLAYGPETAVRARIEQLSSVEHATVLGYPVPIGGTTREPASGEPASGAPRADETTAVTGGGAASDGDGPAARMSAGRGRPLILTVLERDETMRILAGGDAQRTRLAASLLGIGAALLLVALAWMVVAALLPAIISLMPGAAGLVETALAASPDPSPVAGGDPRSNGQGPGLVGSPGLAIFATVVIAAVAVVATSIYVRLTRPTGRAADDARARRPR